MNKFLFAFVFFVLAGCADNNTQQDPNALPPGIMQAVDGSGAVEGGSWLPEIQQQSVPATMQPQH